VEAKPTETGKISGGQRLLAALSVLASMVDRLTRLVMTENSDDVFASSPNVFGNYYAISIAKLANQDWAINLES
jgi:hypothetical protein